MSLNKKFPFRYAFSFLFAFLLIFLAPVYIEASKVDRNLTSNFEASNYGLIPNDITAKNDNATLLIECLNDYGKIIIDDVYYIGRTATTLTATDIAIYGQPGSELLFNNARSTVVFDSTAIKNVLLEDVSIINLSENNVLLFSNSSQTTAQIDSVVIRGCRFEGRMSLYRIRGSETADPSAFGIDEFIFTNNECIDIGMRFIVLNHIPYNYVEISHNTINNFDYTFYYSSTTSAANFAGMTENRVYVYVYNNYVVNDDDWWGSDTSYHCFVLVQGHEVLYDSNHVEGVKSTLGSTVYDAYVSTTHVTYTNNLWKNNILFNREAKEESTTRNVLLKSKTVPGSNGTRIYKHNKWIVEEGFVEQVGLPESDKDLLSTFFFQMGSVLETFVFEDNEVDVYDLLCARGSQRIENYSFKNNVVKAQYALGSLAIIRLVDDYQPTIEFDKNTILISQEETHPEDVSFRLITMRDARETSTHHGFITLTNNTMYVPVTFFLYTVLCETVTIENNYFSVIDDLYSRFSIGGTHPNLDPEVVKEMESEPEVAIILESQSNTELDPELESNLQLAPDLVSVTNINIL